MHKAFGVLGFAFGIGYVIGPVSGGAMSEVCETPWLCPPHQAAPAASRLSVAASRAPRCVRCGRCSKPLWHNVQYSVSAGDDQDAA